MLYIVGLGNPGDGYIDSRHNVGREIVMAFAKKHKLGEFDFSKKKKALVVKERFGKKAVNLILPETFMNKSGAAVENFVRSKKQAESLLVIHDDLDLPLGKIKLVRSRGAGGHKGVLSIEKRLKTKGFMRLRVGIAKADKKGRAKNIKTEEGVKKYVLGKWTPSEKKEIKKVYKNAIDALNYILEEDFYKAQNKFNQ